LAICLSAPSDAAGPVSHFHTNRDRPRPPHAPAASNA
jgi:hypothetical protein